MPPLKLNTSVNFNVRCRMCGAEINDRCEVEVEDGESIVWVAICRDCFGSALDDMAADIYIRAEEEYEAKIHELQDGIEYYEEQMEKGDTE